MDENTLPAPASQPPRFEPGDIAITLADNTYSVWDLDRPGWSAPAPVDQIAPDEYNYIGAVEGTDFYRPKSVGQLINDQNDPIDFKNASAKLAARRSVASLIAAETEETIERTLELLNLAISVGMVGPGQRYISSIGSTCQQCGYTEAITIPAIAGPEDIIQALAAVKSDCPSCEEKRRLAAEAEILAQYIDGLETLDADQDGGAN